MWWKTSMWNKVQAHHLLSVRSLNICDPPTTVCEFTCVRASAFPVCVCVRICKNPSINIYVTDSRLSQNAAMATRAATNICRTQLWNTGAFWILSWISWTSGEGFVLPVTASKVTHCWAPRWAESMSLLKLVQVRSAVTSGYYVLRKKGIIKVSFNLKVTAEMWLPIVTVVLYIPQSGYGIIPRCCSVIALVHCHHLYLLN